ncbi:LysR family transcriptional regulator [Duganella sp. sic0402]|uniref:LysR family transcriptional regulator n=1 Tax=Duganella sp. sic0402 TaxID=2854786 RepID=UPI001C46DF72|nr:LysR family transcriptional regulator [Duganella sp. sic0402]MBV7535304.1 LysR family transcriptional regulator [Duganella sp. sic0402]
MTDLNAINLNRLTTFVAVVEAGSLTAAAERLGLAKSMVSKHMQLLEQEIGVGLLLRSTRKLSLTEAGRSFYESSRQLLAAAEAAIEQARSGSDSPQGTLRVACPIDYGLMVVSPVLAQLRARYPALKIDLTCGEQLIDLIAERIDVTVRLGKLADSGHMAARVDKLTHLLVASPACIARHGMPETPDDLAELPHVALSVLAQPSQFRLTNRTGQVADVRMRNTVFSSNTAYANRAAALGGDGVLRATLFSVKEDLEAGRLVQVLPAWSLPESDIHAVYPATARVPQKVRVFIDALKAHTGGG